MKFTSIAKLGGAAVLSLGLAGCMDITMDIEILSETEARATMTTSMEADIYAMIAAQAEEGDEGFCDEGELIETGTTVDCVVTSSGAFDELDFGDEQGGGPAIEAIGNGQVRVSFPTGDLADQVAEGTGGEQEPEMMAMIAQMFEGAYITMRISGGPIVESNMDIAPDGQSASYQIPLTGVMTGEIDLPEELFAIVQK